MNASLTHCGRLWQIVMIRRSWYARDDIGSDHGPFSTPEQAEDFVRAIVCI